MSYQKELNFFCRLMANYNVQTVQFSLTQVPEVDLGLRRLLGLKPPSASVFPHFKENVIYYATDAFDCSYTCLLLPGGKEVLLLGPYLRHEKNDTDIMTLMEKY